MANSQPKTNVEWQIRNAEKYLGIELLNNSDQYLEIGKIENPENTYVVFNEIYTNNEGGVESTIKTAKNNTLFVVNPIDNKKKTPYFFKAFTCMYVKMSSCFENKSFLIVRPWFEDDKKDFTDLAKHSKDVFNLQEFIRNKQAKQENWFFPIEKAKESKFDKTPEYKKKIEGSIKTKQETQQNNIKFEDAVSFKEKKIKGKGR